MSIIHPDPIVDCYSSLGFSVSLIGLLQIHIQLQYASNILHVHTVNQTTTNIIIQRTRCSVMYKTKVIGNYEILALSYNTDLYRRKDHTAARPQEFIKYQRLIKIHQDRSMISSIQIQRNVVYSWYISTPIRCLVISLHEVAKSLSCVYCE